LKHRLHDSRGKGGIQVSKGIASILVCSVRDALAPIRGGFIDEIKKSNCGVRTAYGVILFNHGYDCTRRLKGH